MNTFSLCVVLMCLSAASVMCIPYHLSSQYASPRLSFSGDSNSLGGGSGGSGGYGGGGASSSSSSSLGGGGGGSGSGGFEDEGGDEHHGHHHHEHHHEEHHEPKPYGFGYAVKDFKKGTSFSQHESSDGHYVKGEYEVALPDGRLQIVKYNADWKNGFNADVKYHGEAHHPDVYATHEDSGLDYKGIH